jgi:hypothetical protein
MSQSNPVFRMSLIATSVALALINAGCGGVSDTTAALTEAAVAGTTATTLTLDETSRRRRESNRSGTVASTTNSSAATFPTTTTSISAASTPTASDSTPTATNTASPAISIPGSTAQTTTTASASTAGKSPIELPLVQSAHMTYQGAFTTPGWTWTGRAMTTYRDPISNKLTLYFVGQDQVFDQIGQISVPDQYSKSLNYSDLPRSSVIQPLTNRITEGEIEKRPSSLGSEGGNGSFIYGLLPYNNRLIITATNWYSYEQLASHGVSGLKLSDTGDFKGFFKLSGPLASFPRAMSGAMAPIPAEWQSLLGGKAIVANAPVSIISVNSYGPALTVFDPDEIGNNISPQGQTLMFYPGSNPLCGAPNCEQTMNDDYTWMSADTGRAFVPGSRTVLTIGIHPYGEMWYGLGTNPATGTETQCNDGGYGQKSTGMHSRVMAFDANDLLAVKKGTKKPWEVRPYAKWRLTDLEQQCFRILNASFDPESSQLFVNVRDRDARNWIHVYTIARPQ